ncbi:MAG: TonB-dependent receptor [Bacteroidales bacterium]|nr:TonB-dependent receptor [Bacteroidales bacterium]
MKLRFTLLLLNLFLAFLLPVSMLAQGGQGRPGTGGERPAIGTIKGKLVDDASGNPIEYGSIAIFSQRDSSIAGGTITDPKGAFKIEQVKVGRYFVKIQFIGYETRYIRDITIRPDNPLADLGQVKLHTTATSIGGVEVTAEREMISSNLDKKVIQVDKTIASVGGTAADVMQTIPSVTVDVEGNVSLRGSSNVIVLIDGKPSGMVDISSGELLQQIPASSIESVEVITNPSVRYDPEGTSGILNIVLKKKSLQGFNGMVSITAGTGDRYNGSLNLNYRQNRFNFFGGYDARTGIFNSSGETRRESSYNGISSLLVQSQSMANERNSHNVNAGFDFYADDFNSFTFSVQYRNMLFGSEGDILSTTYNANDSLTRSFKRYSNSEREIQSFTYNASYKRLFEKKGKELTVDFMVNDNSMGGSQDIRQEEFTSGMPQMDPVLQLSGSDNTNRMYMLQANYTTPAGKGGRIETGFKGTVKDLQMRNFLKDYVYESESWEVNPLANNFFDYSEQIYAVYGIYSSSYKKLKYQAGLRVEQLLSDSELELTSEKFSRSYPSLYPSVHLQYEKNEKSQFQLSYSRRVSRPSHRQLNPFVDYSDSLNIRYGNPKLDPEFINSYELGWLYFTKKGSLNATAFYRHTTGIIERITELREGGITAGTFENLGSASNLGIEMIVNGDINKWLKANANVSGFRTVVVGDEIAGIETVTGTVFTAKANVTFMVFKDLSLMLSGNYRSPEIEAQEKEEAVYFADAALKYDFLKRKASLSLRVSDIFDSRKFDSETTGEGFTITSNQRRDSRIAYLGFTYRINNYNRLKERERSGQQEQDMEEF